MTRDMLNQGGRPPRSYLFVPANRPDRIGKALAAGADAVIVDFEDAVAPADKAAARENLRAPWPALAQQAADAGVLLLVRVNAAGTPYHDDDIGWCRALGIDTLVLPKADAQAMQPLRQALPGVQCHALLETAAGFAQLAQLAVQPGVVRLLFGSIDLMGDLGVGDEGEPLHAFRSLLVLHSRAAGLPAPVDGVCTALGDTAVLAAETARARAFGFGAKLLIHPAQIGPVHAGLAPTEAELAWARRIVEAAGAADGAAVAVDGKMVDRPVLERARRILAHG
ncbi:HpcH/HpaI aldolase/citrate lyase family protein [Cupriavidus gilardii]|uniref:HpcH/HpaI aldolase/citrate lyase family protein n=1 Tax=Cupriavidus gilardii TaxID=82541 RepID=UPI001FC9248E|nr:CoA ester lyase [Cupriavidus gilardii]